MFTMFLVGVATIAVGTLVGAFTLFGQPRTPVTTTTDTATLPPRQDRPAVGGNSTTGPSAPVEGAGALGAWAGPEWARPSHDIRPGIRRRVGSLLLLILLTTGLATIIASAVGLVVLLVSTKIH
ncbi:MAG: hypothetical protein R2698_06730 [Microthrixaceae bacterium]